LISRRRIKSLLGVLRTLPVRLLARVVPYSSGAYLLQWLANHPGWFPRRVELIEKAYRTLPINAHCDKIVTHSLAANILRFYRLAALARCSDRQLERWLEIDGLDILEQALGQGRGVIVLNSHTSLAHLLTFVLHRSGHSDLHTVGDDSMKLNLLGIEAKAEQPATAGTKQSAFLQQLQVAKLILRNGGLVQIAGDGSYGTSGIDAELFGRKRFFRKGFAELAALTRAEVVPALVTMRPDGVVKVRFETPFPRSPHKQASRVLVEDLMRHYIELIRRIWREHLGDLKWRQLERFLALPRWQE